jgi:hypothetical protein
MVNPLGIEVCPISLKQVDTGARNKESYYLKYTRNDSLKVLKLGMQANIQVKR